MTMRGGVQALLGLRTAPVAIGYFQAPPAGIGRYEGAVPAGCAFWSLAQAGRTFYTVPADHYACAVGAYTHALALPPERAGELNETIGFMVEQRYLRMEDIPTIPTLSAAPAIVAYGPADAGAFAPDVVIVAAEPAQAMLLLEAAQRAGAGDAAAPVLGRPGCAVAPLTSQSGKAALSLGCKGNRTYTGLPDGELYVCLPGRRWADVAAALVEIVQANEAMGAYYAAKQGALG